MAGRAPDTLPRATDWTARAACRDDDPEIYFDERAKSGLACAYCPVRGVCLEEALTAEGSLGADERFGIYGGLTSRERVTIARERGFGPRRHSGGRRLAACGTEAAYNRHVRNGDVIDEPCRRAHTAEAARMRAMRRAVR